MQLNLNKLNLNKLNLNKLTPAFNLSEGGVFCLQDQLSYELSLFRYQVCVI